MILKKGEWLFVSTMKCATNSLYTALQEPEIGGKWCGGSGFHSIPHEFSSGERVRMAPVHFSACRNPYSRAVSIWASTCMRPENRLKYEPWTFISWNGGDPESFDYFVHMVLANPQRPEFRVPWLYRNQSEWQARFICDAVVHTENLEQELERLLCITVTLPVENESQHDAWESYYKDQATREAVEKWAGDDFEVFGYEA